MASASYQQFIGGGAPIIKSRRRRPQIVGGGAARPAHGSSIHWRIQSYQTFRKGDKFLVK